MADFLFKCETCGGEQMIPLTSNQRRFCEPCSARAHVLTRRRKRERARAEEMARRVAMGLPAVKPKQKTGVGKFKLGRMCVECAGVPDRRPRGGCKCGEPYLVEGRDGRWLPPQAEKAG